MSEEAGRLHPIPPTGDQETTGPAARGEPDIRTLATRIHELNEQAAAESVLLGEGIR
jgi:hypothetical protein